MPNEKSLLYALQRCTAPEQILTCCDAKRRGGGEIPGEKILAEMYLKGRRLMKQRLQGNAEYALH